MTVHALNHPSVDIYFAGFHMLASAKWARFKNGHGSSCFCHKYIGMSQTSSSRWWIKTHADMQSGMAGLNLQLFRASTHPRRFRGEMALRSTSAP
jgi:hypothetical protein